MQQNFVVSLYCNRFFSWKVHFPTKPSKFGQFTNSLSWLPEDISAQTSRVRIVLQSHLTFACNAEALRAREFLVFFKKISQFHMMWCEGVSLVGDYFCWVFNILKSLFESEDHQYGSAFWNLPKRQWNWQKYIVYWAWHISFFLLMRSVLR